MITNVNLRDIYPGSRIWVGLETLGEYKEIFNFKVERFRHQHCDALQLRINHRDSQRSIMIRMRHEFLRSAEIVCDLGYDNITVHMNSQLDPIFAFGFYIEGCEICGSLFNSHVNGTGREYDIKGIKSVCVDCRKELVRDPKFLNYFYCV